MFYHGVPVLLGLVALLGCSTNREIRYDKGSRESYEIKRSMDLWPLKWNYTRKKCATSNSYNREFAFWFIEFSYSKDERYPDPPPRSLQPELDFGERMQACWDDIHARDSNGSTPLHRAVAEGDEELVQLLVSMGADLNARDLEGKTPLHIAIIRDRKEISTLLLTHGADPSLEDGEGKMPLHYAKGPLEGLEE
jgi:hypothetical protein